jgi:hypothetical protein
MNLNELRRMLAARVAEARALLDGAGDRALTQDEEARYASLLAEADALRAQVQAEERRLDAEARAVGAGGGAAGAAVGGQGYGAGYGAGYGTGGGRRGRRGRRGRHGLSPRVSIKRACSSWDRFRPALAASAFKYLGIVTFVRSRALSCSLRYSSMSTSTQDTSSPGSQAGALTDGSGISCPKSCFTTQTAQMASLAM